MVMGGLHGSEQQEGPGSIEPNECRAVVEGLWVGMLLEAWWSAIWLALWRMAHWENHNHNRNDRHWESASAHKYPGDDREAGKNDEKTLRWLLNQVIQEFGRTGEMNHGMFHTILLRFFDSWRLPADKLQHVSC